MNECINKALAKQSQKIWYCSPLYKQTKEIAWNLFDFYVPKELIAKKNESELKITFINGSEISLKGTDNPDSLVGVGLNFCVLDEFPLMDSAVWYKIVRPMMIDTKGHGLFIGTPRGFNWAYDLHRQNLTDSDFESFFFKTVDNTSIDDMDKEVNKAKAEATSELDKIVFRQEYEATFEMITGRPRFDVSLISNLRKSMIAPIKSIGLLNLYSELNPLHKYIIGCDTSEGLSTGDNSSVTVLDAKDYSVAAHYSGKMEPDVLASYLKEWGDLFNQALIVVESNNHGLVTIKYLKDLYKYLYSRKTYDKLSDEWSEKIGFQTSARTKPLLIANLDKALRSGLDIKADQIIDELMTYIIEDDGATNASEGKKDDSVISLALAVQGYLETHTTTIPKAEEPMLEGTVAHLMAQKKEAGKSVHQYSGFRFRA